MTEGLGKYKIEVMNREKYYLTRKGLKRVKERLQQLEEEKLEKIKERGSSVIEYKEVDSDYVSYQEELGQIKEKIHGLRKILDSYEIIQAPPKSERDVIGLGATVVIDMGGTIEEFTIVGTFETDPARQKISNGSPLGKALLGKRAGEEVEVKAGIKKNVCKIIKVKYEEF